MTQVKIIQVIGAMLFCMLFAQNRVAAQQQMENSMSQYFRNQMLWNAGFTGAEGNKLYALQNRSWIGFDGAPVMTSFTGELNFGKNSAVGAQILSDVTGLLYRTFGIANYAYRIKLKEDEQVRVGISLTFLGDRIDHTHLIQENPVDPFLDNSIRQKLQFDGNIGAVYTKANFTFGASFFRLSENIGGKTGGDANLAYAQFGAKYKTYFDSEEKAGITPLAMLRLYKTTAAVMDFGAQFEFNKLVNVMALYQTTGNIRAGAGISLSELGEANFFYNTNVKVANTYSQQFEIGLAYYLKKKKN